MGTLKQKSQNRFFEPWDTPGPLNGLEHFKKRFIQIKTILSTLNVSKFMVVVSFGKQ